MQNDQSAIVTRNLTKRFGDFVAVDGIDFDVRPGEIFGFLGPNGAGKTTTIRMMLGLLKPTAGTVSVLGVPMTEHPERIRPRIGYMAQRFSLYDDLTILQNLRFYGRAYGLDDDVLRERIQNAIQTAGLEGREHTHTKDLSGGWRQRLALNAAILHQPELVFLDEPTAGVDPVSRRAFWNLLYKLVADGITVFVTTHYMDEAEHCHRLAFIQHGRLIAYGTPEEIKRDKMRGQVLEIDCTQADAAMSVLRQMGAFEDVALYGTLIHAVTEDAISSKPRIAQGLAEAGVRVRAIDVVAPSLEDVFISSVRSTGRE
jgi:ABC-2 type transport system ATP-binding protein